MPKGDAHTPCVKSKEIRMRQSALLLGEMFGPRYPLRAISDRPFARIIEAKLNAGQRACEELDRIADEHHCTYREGKKIE